MHVLSDCRVDYLRAGPVTCSTLPPPLHPGGDDKRHRNKYLLFLARRLRLFVCFLPLPGGGVAVVPFSVCGTAVCATNFGWYSSSLLE